MFLTRLQITLTLNKLAEYSCKLFPFGCLIIQYAFKEHGDERRKIPLSNITILARGSTLSVFKECLGRINLHKKKEHQLIQVVKIAIVPQGLICKVIHYLLLMQTKHSEQKEQLSVFPSWKATDGESTINKSEEEQRVSIFLPTKNQPKAGRELSDFFSVKNHT